MNKISLDFKNCYGIKKLQAVFDFTQNNTFAVYAPNGVMKTSFAKTFQDISLGNKTGDRIFKDRETERVVTDENGQDVNAENIFVIEPYLEGYKSDRISTLLVNNALKNEFEQIHNAIDEKKEQLLMEVRVSSGIKNDLEEIIAETITHDSKQFFTALNRIKSEVLANNEPQLADIQYLKIFNEKVIKVIQDGTFRSQLHNYITTYDNLVSSSTFFRKGAFTHNNAADIAKSLKDNGFFKAQHSVFVTSGGVKKEINNEKELTEVIQQEKETILTNPELSKAFEAIDKKLEGNKELREFREYIEQNQDLIPELANLERFKQKLWIAYIAKSLETFKILLEEYEKGEVRMREITIRAKDEATRWREVIEIFNTRFFVPFKVSMDNQAQVILNDEVPTLSFEFKDEATGGTIPIGEKDLMRVLSNGERRAFYILNIIFEVEARKSSATETLFVIDDIADSFDYKNKYAIIEYLNEINETSIFKQIILTHNFDFYRTVAGRLSLPRENHLHTIKSDTEIKIVEEHYQNNPFTYWKKNLERDNSMLLASIPFVRNLAEYCGHRTEYEKLTSLLHIKPDTDTITLGDLEVILKTILVNKSTLNLSDKTKIVKNLIFELAQQISAENDENIDLEKKIVLSIAIRLKAEEFMISKINNSAFVNSIDSNQTIALIRHYKNTFPSDTTTIDLMEQVNLMTPENIHLNSFMYEPILDMANDHLKQLFNRVCSV